MATVINQNNFCIVENFGFIGRCLVFTLMILEPLRRFKNKWHMPEDCLIFELYSDWYEKKKNDTISFKIVRIYLISIECKKASKSF